MKNVTLLFAAGLIAFQRGAAADPTSSPSPPPAVQAPVENPELIRIYSEDQSDRMPADGKPIDWGIVSPRDRARAIRVKELYASGQLLAGADYFHAAMVLQHGEEPEDFLLCHELCVAAVINGSKPARWLAAASEDRFLMTIGRPQRFGTQFRSMGDGPMTLYQTQEGVTDGLRKTFGVPTLAESKAREAKMNPKPKAPVASPSLTPTDTAAAASVPPSRP
jgi:hypothetical protein